MDEIVEGLWALHEAYLRKPKRKSLDSIHRVILAALRDVSSSEEFQERLSMRQTVADLMREVRWIEYFETQTDRYMQFDRKPVQSKRLATKENT